MAGLFTPLARAFAQLDDPVFRGVLLRSVGWAALAFLALLATAVWLAGHLAGSGWRGWFAEAASGIGASLLAFWLFIPIAAAIGTLYLDRVAQAVERRFYPCLPPAKGAQLSVQLWDSIAIGLRILGLNVIALILLAALPGLGLAIAWAVAAYAVGRGLFVAVAMRRMGRAEAHALYQRRRLIVLAHGAVLALAGYVPPANLLIPVIGVAAMVHAFQRAAG
ncbi:MAG: EI24 domain-containing protein [Acetobacteraceae bacterium]|nr:EI24 domain-containing protein [Acetobacteraceae bacterium]